MSTEGWSERFQRTHPIAILEALMSYANSRSSPRTAAPTVHLHTPPRQEVSGDSPTIGIEEPGSGLPSSLITASMDARYWQRCALGEGGHGRVHRCIDVVLKRPVAVKTTLHELLGDPDTEQLLERESRILARLEHRNIVPI